MSTRRGLIQLNLLGGDGEQARAVSAEVVAQGDRTAVTLLLRVEALLTDIDTVPPEDRTAHANEVERLCTEILENSTDLPDARIRKALVGRIAARRVLGRLEDAQSDAERALEIQPDDLRVLSQAAQARLQAGDEDGALALLVGPVVEESPDVTRYACGPFVGGSRSSKRAEGP